MANFLLTMLFGAAALCVVAYNVLIAYGSDPAAALAISIVCIACCVASFVLTDLDAPEFSITAWAMPLGASAFATHQTITTDNVVAFAVLACMVPLSLRSEWAFATITSRLMALIAASLTLVGLYGQTTAIGYGTAAGLWLTVALACVRPLGPTTDPLPSK